jgi:hypothetical protein
MHYFCTIIANTFIELIIMRGGARPGAGRPKIYGKRVQLSILISEETKAKLKELAIAHEKPLASVVEQLIINEYNETMLMS